MAPRLESAALDTVWPACSLLGVLDVHAGVPGGRVHATLLGRGKSVEGRFQIPQLG